VWNFKGNFTDSHNATYSVYESQRVNEPSIQGTSTFNQYWSVRAEPRTNGSVNTGEHFNKWNSLNMHLGNQNEMILAVEGYTNASHPTPSGSASMTVS
jgi:endo-1,4-beta-xylanase